MNFQIGWTEGREAMEIKRTHILSIYIVLLTMTSCKLYENKQRHKQEEAELEWQNLEQRQRLYTFRQDTLSRSWYFWTDTVFRFHADSGLTGQRGRLFMQESRTNISLKNAVVKKVNNSALQRTQKSISDKRRSISLPNFWLIGLIAIIVLVSLKFRRVVKTFLS